MLQSGQSFDTKTVYKNNFCHADMILLSSDFINTELLEEEEDAEMDDELLDELDDEDLDDALLDDEVPLVPLVDEALDDAEEHTLEGKLFGEGDDGEEEEDAEDMDYDSFDDKDDL